MASLAVFAVDRRTEYEDRLAAHLREIKDARKREAERRALYGRARKGNVVLKRLVRHFRMRDELRRRGPEPAPVHDPDAYLGRHA